MSEDPESFLQEESTVDRLVIMLNDITQKETEGIKKKEEKVEESSTEDDDNFIVSDYFFHDPTSRSTKKTQLMKQMSANTKKFTFVRQFETDPEQRASIRREVEYLANNFRYKGNEMYRLGKYQEAIHLYSRGLECIVDTPVLFCNRGLSYAKLANYKRALMDFDYVINRLDQKCLRAWLCRAACHWRLEDEYNYLQSIKYAREYNIGEREYIETFVEKMKAEF